MDEPTSLLLQLTESRLGALESLTDEMLALESFTILHRLENIFFRWINNFTVNLTRGFRDFKRSELRAYIESNHGDVRRLFTQKNWLLLQNIGVPIPKGLDKPYASTVDHVLDGLKTIEAKDVFTHFDHLVTALTHEATTITAAPENFTTKALKLLQTWTLPNDFPIETTLTPYLDLQRRGQKDVAAKTVFDSIDDVLHCHTIILQYEPFFTQALATNKTLRTLDQNLDRLIDQLEKTRLPSVEFTKEFYRIIRTVIYALDGYAAYLTGAQVLEHCFVLDLTAFNRVLQK